MTPHVEATIESGDWPPLAEIAPLAARAVAAAAAAAQLVFVPGAEVSVLFTDDAHVRALNAVWRGIDKATNVLSFPSAGSADQAMLLGDIVIACETVRREADSLQVPFTDHVMHLIVHGFLHLVGFDHEIDADADKMEEMERVVLAGFGIGDPYRDIACHELK